MRLLKWWAVRRGIYSNKAGYLGGVQLAIMVAKITQFYPRALASTVVAKFFKIFSLWPWPQAVELVERVVKGNHTRDGVNWAELDRQIWRAKGAGREVMPIITPAYPGMNSTFAVNRATLRVIREEFDRGGDFLRGVEAEVDSWAGVVQPTDFFTRFAKFFRLDVVASTAAEHEQWLGLVR